MALHNKLGFLLYLLKSFSCISSLFMHEGINTLFVIKTTLTHVPTCIMKGFSPKSNIEGSHLTYITDEKDISFSKFYGWNFSNCGYPRMMVVLGNVWSCWERVWSHLSFKGNQITKYFFVMTEIKTQNAEKLVEDIGALIENTEVGNIDLGTGY